LLPDFTFDFKEVVGLAGSLSTGFGGLCDTDGFCSALTHKIHKKELSDVKLDGHNGVRLE
jgi:hypothetical protein